MIAVCKHQTVLDIVPTAPLGVFEVVRAIWVSIAKRLFSCWFLKKSPADNRGFFVCLYQPMACETMALSPFSKLSALVTLSLSK